MISIVPLHFRVQRFFGCIPVSGIKKADPERSLKKNILRFRYY